MYEVWEQNVAVLIGLAAVMSFWIKGGELRPQSPVRDPLETSQCGKVGKAKGSNWSQTRCCIKNLAIVEVEFAWKKPVTLQTLAFHSLSCSETKGCDANQTQRKFAFKIKVASKTKTLYLVCITLFIKCSFEMMISFICGEKLSNLQLRDGSGSN